MSSLLACLQPGAGLPDVFVPPESPALLIKKLAAVPRLTPVTSASRLEIRPEPQMVSSGIAAVDALTGGLPRGCLSEICGPPSSGRTSVLLAALASATRRQEACALLDISDALDPQSAKAAGVELKNLLWVRCNPDLPRKPAVAGKRKTDFDCLDQALKATDLLLQSGGFGLVVMDLGDVPAQAARRIPLTSWFRFRRAVENTPTVLLVMALSSCARTCASLVVELRSEVVRRRSSEKPSGISGPLSETGPAHGHILAGLEVRAEVMRSRLERKPAQSVTSFMTKANVLGGAAL
jgi:hypothetical protein